MKFIILAVIIIVSVAGYFAVEKQKQPADELRIPLQFQE